MSADPLCSAVYHDISPMIDGSDEISSSAKGIVDYDGYTSVMGYFGNGLEIGNVVFGIAD